MFLLLSLLVVTLVSSECEDMPNWGCDLIESAEDCNGLQMKKCLKACNMCPEEEASAEEPEPECADAPNWGCEDIKVIDEDCNGLKMKKCLKSCNQCGGDEASAESEEPEPQCTETFAPVCEVCGEGEDCGGMSYKITTTGEGSMGRFGCTYPKSYEFVNSGDGCPEIVVEAECGGLDCKACLAVPDNGCGFADGACYVAGKEPMDATSYAFTDADCPADKPSCEGLDCAGCLAVPDYGCGFADGTCYEAGKEPMDATSYAFTTDDCPKDKPSCEGLDCAGCLAVPDYGCGFADGTCYEAGKEPMDATSYAFTTDDCPKEESAESEESPEPEEVEDCTCGIGAVKGEEKFQSGSAEGDKMCQFGTNCATFFEGCADKGATVCSLKIEYAEVVEDCSCGIGAVKGEEKFQSGSADGDKMCQFGTNCATFFEGCADKGATVCNLKIEYVEPESVESVESVESEESEEPEVKCSKDDCLKPCKGKKRKQCQVKKNSKCPDKRARGKGKRQKFFSFAACKAPGKSKTFAAYEAPAASPTTEDYLIYGFALVGLVVLTRTTFVLGKRMTASRYKLVEEYDLEL